MGMILVVYLLFSEVVPALPGDTGAGVASGLVVVACAALAAWPLILKAKAELASTRAAVETPPGKPALGDLATDILAVAARNARVMEDIRESVDSIDQRVTLLERKQSHTGPLTD